ncbi:hypothetical protein ZIOFF_066071 [Zingiber officinale]|uniref:Bulb-type lectin domain-containing protein n=1 Tax=Zingiber officinale TaxID=94328 RepID=A0A8J5KDK3_ZINOF|nr:hypothetical protein ZIOFF_066071 [Zingiber officinale]
MAALVMLSVAVLLGLLLPSSTADRCFLRNGETLKNGDSLTQGDYALTMQTDCGLVLYHNGQPVRNISEDTIGKGENCLLHLHDNGDLAIYNYKDEIPIFIWATGTNGVDGHYILVLMTDAVAIYGPEKIFYDGPYLQPKNRKIAMVTKN